MINILLFWLAVSSSDFSLASLNKVQEQIADQTRLISELPVISTQLSQIKEMLEKEPGLNPAVINKVVTTLRCASEYNTATNNNVLTVIDYSLPSNEKRLWVFDLNTKKMLFHTYVSHGIKSGALLTNYFSNKNDSKASSIGVYKTEQSYYGREGLSLRLSGLDQSFNDNASNRYIVMHGGWYMDENFIKRYGRPGRSWGCPAVPLSEYKPIINTIKENSLLVVYYPSDEWFVKSKFLNCGKADAAQMNRPVVQPNAIRVEDEPRESILFADLNHDNKRAEEDPIVVMSADNYERIFHARAPLERMLRRQINSAEYIALSEAEFNKLVAQNDRDGLDNIHFVIPFLIMYNGTYETQMKFVEMGKIKDVRSSAGGTDDSLVSAKSYTVNFESKPMINLKATNRFIRWLGL